MNAEHVPGVLTHTYRTWSSATGESYTHDLDLAQRELRELCLPHMLKLISCIHW